jgi:hypothetical protein
MNIKPNPPSIQPDQALKTWLFSQNTDGSLSPANIGGGSGGNVNLTGINGAEPEISNPLAVELSDGTNPFGTAGNPLSVNVLSGGGSNASVGTDNVAAPGSSTQIGSQDAGGKLQAVSASNPIPASIISQDVIDATNSSTTPLAGGATYTGSWRSAIGFGALEVSVDTDVISANTSSTGLVIQWSQDGVNIGDVDLAYITSTSVWSGPASGGQTYIFPAKRPYYRVVYTNGASNQTVFRLQTILKVVVLNGTITDLDDVVTFDMHGELVRAQLIGKYSTGNALLAVGVDSSGNLNQDLTGIGGSSVSIAVPGVQLVGIEGHAGGAFDAALGAAKPANVVQVGGNDGTDVYAVPLTSGGAAVAVVDSASQTSLATLAGAVTSSLLQNNMADWGGQAVAAAVNGTPVGTEYAPVVRAIPAKVCRAISTTNPTTNATVYYGPSGMSSTRAGAGWYDTGQTGATYLEVAWYANTWQNAGADGCYIDACDDQTNGPVTQLNSNAAQSGIVTADISQRYWQVRYINGNVSVTTFTLNSTERQAPPAVSINPASGAQVLDGTWNANEGYYSGNTMGFNVNNGITIRTESPLAVVPMVSASNAGNFYYQRTPTTFKTTTATASGNTALWTPTSGKKFRLMRYKVEITSDAVAGTAGDLAVTFQDSSTDCGLGHSCYIPSTAGTTFGNGYSSDWIDLGNGKLSAAANNVLNVNLSFALTGGVVRVTCCGTEE